MADSKISQLTAITGAQLDDINDLFPIVDDSAAETKKISVAELFTGRNFINGNVDNTPIGEITPAAGTFTDFVSDTVETDDIKVQAANAEVLVESTSGIGPQVKLEATLGDDYAIQNDDGVFSLVHGVNSIYGNPHLTLSNLGGLSLNDVGTGNQVFNVADHGYVTIGDHVGTRAIDVETLDNINIRLNNKTASGGQTRILMERNSVQEWNFGINAVGEFSFFDVVGSATRMYFRTNGDVDVPGKLIGGTMENGGMTVTSGGVNVTGESTFNSKVNLGEVEVTGDLTKTGTGNQAITVESTNSGDAQINLWRGSATNWSMSNDGGTFRILKGLAGAAPSETAYSIAAASHSWRLDGTEHMLLNSDGDVGLGFNNPAARLHVRNHSGNVAVFESTGGNNAYIRFNDTGTEKWHMGFNTGADSFRIVDSPSGNVPLQIEAGAASNSIFVENTGEVAIGHSSPASKLHVESTSELVARLESTVGGQGSYVRYTNAAGDDTSVGINSSGDFKIVNVDGGGTPLSIDKLAPTNSIFVDHAGRVNIGTSGFTSTNMYVSGSMGVNRNGYRVFGGAAETSVTVLGVHNQNDVIVGSMSASGIDGTTNRPDWTWIGADLTLDFNGDFHYRGDGDKRFQIESDTNGAVKLDLIRATANSYGLHALASGFFHIRRSGDGTEPDEERYRIGTTQQNWYQGSASTEMMRLDAGKLVFGEGYTGGSPEANLHVKHADAGFGPSGSANIAVFESNANMGISLMTSESGDARIFFGHQNTSNNQARIESRGTEKDLRIGTNTSSGEIALLVSNLQEVARFHDDGYTTFGDDTGIKGGAVTVTVNDANENTVFVRTRATPNNTEGLRIRNDAVGSNTWDFATFRSDSGNNTRFRFEGGGNGKCDGSWTGGGADYAEWAEWIDGNPDNEDRRGWSVVWEGDKIRKAEAYETPAGVISANPSIVGNGDMDFWTGKFLRDEFNQIITETVKHVDEKTGEVYYTEDQVLNPEWDEDEEYIPREERKEWSMVGFLGRIPMLKGHVAGGNWIKLKENENTVEYFVK